MLRSALLSGQLRVVPVATVSGCARLISHPAGYTKRLGGECSIPDGWINYSFNSMIYWAMASSLKVTSFGNNEPHVLMLVRNRLSILKSRLPQGSTKRPISAVGRSCPVWWPGYRFRFWGGSTAGWTRWQTPGSFDPQARFRKKRS